MMTTLHPTAEHYLKRLEVAARSLPRRDRDELVDEIREHLSIGIPADASEADVRNVLDDLGAPEDIVGAARPADDPGTPRRGAREAWALALLIIGLPPGIGWLVGLALLTWSPMWTTGQKWLGALGSLGGIPGVFLLFNLVLPSLTGFVIWNPLATLIPGLVVQISVGIYLYRAAGRR